MLTWESSKIVGYEGGVAVELRRGHCLSTDTKPTGPSIGNGSYLREMDTGDEYEYDAENDIWRAGSGGGGGGSLPAVTSEDNGDVLTVVNGAWDKAAPSGGGMFVVTNAEDETTGIYGLDKTFAEIKAAADAGKFPVLVYDEEVNDEEEQTFVTIRCFYPFQYIRWGTHAGAPQYMVGVEDDNYLSDSENGFLAFSD